MNTEQLLGLVRRLLQEEQRLTIQQKLAETAQAFANLAGNPQHQPNQTELANKLKLLEQTLDKLEASYSPGFRTRMEAIGALPYFTSAITARLRQSMSDNPMSPAVVNQDAQTLLSERQNYINNLNNLSGSLQAFGFELNELEPGQAEVGFQIPRIIFDNDLEGFSKELHELRLMIRAFSEAAGNAGEQIELRQISTSDPLIFLLLGYHTVKLIGSGAKWCLDQWKTLEDIRNLRASTANLKIPAAQNLAEQYDALINETVQANVRQEAERLAGESGADKARQNELSTHLEMALHGMLERIERGMTVELRFLPPTKPAEGEATEATETAAADFDELTKLQQQLVFPAASDKPLLTLTKQPEEAGQKGKGKPNPPTSEA
jgi:hypothetical protein